MRTSRFHSSFKLTKRLYRSPATTTNILRLLWILLISWGELGVYHWSLSRCRWPVHETPGEALHALLISDTQIYIPSEITSLFPHPRGFLANKYMKKSWHVARRLNPHAVLFLGDMLKNGKSAANEAEFARLAQEFKATFPLDDSAVVYYLPGNNDVGMGLLSSPTKNIRKFYQKYFGPLNEVFTLKNHTFLALDAPGLVDEDYHRNTNGVSFDRWEPIPGGVVEAVRTVATQHYHPLVLLSHIPLYRPDSALCGPHRERGTIVRSVGHGYQNTLGKQTTAFLIKMLEPVAVFSGDNRDYCEYVHKGTSFDVAGPIPEITIKSFSQSPHIRRPGFQLVSIIDPSNPAFVASEIQPLLSRPCILPDQTVVFTGYIWWIFITICIVLVLNVQRIRNFRITKDFDLSLTPSSDRSDNTSPLLQGPNPLSPTWSPHTPFPLASPKSPREDMPPTFRTPIAPTTPTFRASSRPMTPQGLNDSLMLSPQLMPPMHDDEDSMFPDRYTTQRDVRHLNDEEWTSIGREDYFDPGSQTMDGVSSGADESRGFSSPSHFISAPGGMRLHYKERGSSTVLWSKSFVLAGKRRRFVLRIPQLSVWWNGLLEVFEILRDADQRTLIRRRRGILTSTLLESISILWPAGIVWLVVNFWMF